MNKLSGPIGLIKKSLEIYSKKENFIYFFRVQSPLLPITFIIFIWSLVLTLAASKLPENLAANSMVTFSVAILQFINSLVRIFVVVASLIAVKRVFEGEELSARETFLAAKSRVGKYVILGLLLALIYVLGFVLFIIPGIIFSVWYAFSGFELVQEGSGIKESLRKSKDLVKGKFWSLLGRFFVFLLFGTLIEILLVLAPYGIGSLVSPVLGILFILPSYLLFKELEGRGQVLGRELPSSRES